MAWTKDQNEDAYVADNIPKSIWNNFSANQSLANSAEIARFDRIFSTQWAQKRRTF